jgi:hypothetical protein
MMSPGRALLPAGKQALTGVDAFGSAAMRWTRRADRGCRHQDVGIAAAVYRF